MSTSSDGFKNSLPQSGWVMDIQLAEIIGISRETLLDWLTKFSIPHRRPGTRVFVRMETFYDGLPEGLSDADTKPSLR